MSVDDGLDGSDDGEVMITMRCFCWRKYCPSPKLQTEQAFGERGLLHFKKNSKLQTIIKPKAKNAEKTLKPKP